MKIKICQHCGKEIVAKNRTMFCSVECRSVFYGSSKGEKEVETIKHHIVKSESPVIKICQYCGKEFKPSGHNQRFCSYECNYKFSRTISKTANIVKICLHCNKEYITTKKKCKYCSRECASKARFGVYNILTTTKCKHCGKDFKPAKIKQKYCSQECYFATLYVNQRFYGARLKNPVIRTCKHCGKEYKPWRVTQNYCGSDCYLANTFDPKVKTICARCGKEIIALKSLNKIYCNKKCHYEAKSNTGEYIKQELKNCLYCGKEFLSVKGAKYCSRKCSGLTNFGKYEEVQTKICVHCGKEYKTHRDQMHCSMECHDNYRCSLHYVPAINKLKTCEYCGKEFRTTALRHFYCNPKCCKKAWEEKNRKGLSVVRNI